MGLSLQAVSALMTTQRQSDHLSVEWPLHTGFRLRRCPHGNVTLAGALTTVRHWFRMSLMTQ